MKTSTLESIHRDIINRNELVEVIDNIKANILDYYRVSDDPNDDTPGTCLTVATDGNHESNNAWGYQTGDNSYAGACYHYRHWAVVNVYRDSDTESLVEEILNQLYDLIDS